MRLSVLESVKELPIQLFELLNELVFVHSRHAWAAQRFRKTRVGYLALNSLLGLDEFTPGQHTHRLI